MVAGCSSGDPWSRQWTGRTESASGSYLVGRCRASEALSRPGRITQPLKSIAYIETSIVSYLTARPSRDVVIVARQPVTREWWRTARDRFHLAASELVIREARQGYPNAVRARLTRLDGVTLLDASEEAEQLARELIASRAVPPSAAVDAAHIAIAVTNRVHYLVTWNFRHIANATMRSRIERVCRSDGYEPPVICTPNELMEVSHGDQ